MKIWYISQYYPPEVGAPSARVSGLAKSWQEAGDDVLVLTGIPNHPDGRVPEAYAHQPSYYNELLDGIRVSRHWLYVAPNTGKWPRLFNQLSFAASILWKNFRLRPELFRPDVIVATSPSFFHVLSAWFLARLHGAKFVFEVRDLWPAIFVQMGIFREDSLIVKVLEALEMFLYRRADAIVTVTRGFAEEIASRGIDRRKILVVTNGVSDDDLKEFLAVSQNGSASRLRAQLGISPLSKVVLYIGNHGEAQALGQVVDAARMLVRRTDTVFLMVGSGSDRDRLVAYAKGIPNIQFLPAVSHKEAMVYYSMADINLVCLKNIPDFAMFIPSKMFEIMAAKTCAVAALQGEGAAIMKESGCALVVPSEDPEKISSALVALLDDAPRRKQMAESGRQYVEQHFKHSLLAGRYRQMLMALTGVS